MTTITPAFKGRQITICFAVDRRYLPALGVAIQSIINHASELKKYDICVLHAGLEQARARKLERMSRKNVAIRFFCVNEMVGQDRVAQLYATRRFPKEACFRFFIPKVFGKIRKVLYMDCDVVVNRDVAELFGEHLSNEAYMGIVHDTYAIYTAHSDETYYREKLKLKQPRDYFQSGVMLLNLTAMRKDKVAKKILQTMEGAGNLRFPDQDVLNMVCEGHVQYLDGRWNVEYHIPLCAPNYRQVLTAEETAEYERCYADPWILHFCGSRKPWTNPMYPLSETFWGYARESPFYEELLYHNIQDNARRELSKVLAEQDANASTPTDKLQQKRKTRSI